MKKLISALCAFAMILGLVSPAFADGSITVPVTEIKAVNASGEKMAATSITELSPDVMSSIITDPTIKIIINSYRNGKAQEAYDRIKILAGDDVKTESGTEINLDDYEPVDTLALIDTEDLAGKIKVGEIDVATNFEMSQGKAIEDYLVCILNPEKDNDLVDQVMFVEPELNDDEEFAYKLPYYPALVQILEKQ